MGATGPQTVPTQGNPLTPVNVDAGGYTMTATSPPNFTLVACGGIVDAEQRRDLRHRIGEGAERRRRCRHLLRHGDLHHPGDDADHHADDADLAAHDVTEPDDADDRPDGATPSPATTAPASLAFTGAPVGKEWMFGIGALILGSGLILTSRLRLRLRRPKHAASKQK